MCLIFTIWIIYIFRTAYKYGGGVFFPDFSRWQQAKGSFLRYDSFWAKTCYYFLFLILIFTIAGTIFEFYVLTQIVEGITSAQSSDFPESIEIIEPMEWE